MRYILIFILFINTIFGVDLTVENISNKVIKKSLPKKKIYFGKSLFQGEFKDNNQIRYTPDYIINIGDEISIKLWGSYNYIGKVKVDTQGNIFIPKVGTVHLLGVKNRNLEKRVAKSINSVIVMYLFMPIWRGINQYLYCNWRL